MLEYLYDLLEGAERQAFQGHLDGCAACRAALAQAQAQQNLLAAAARIEFPAVRFQPPTDAITPLLRATVPLPRPQRSRAWRRWVAAAILLLTLSGVAGAAFWLGVDYREASAVAERQESAVAEARKEQSEIRNQWDGLPALERAKIEAVLHAQREKEVKLKVTGPATVQAGASAEFHIQTENLNDVPATADVTASFVDETGKKSEPLALARTGDGLYRLSLIPDRRVRPGSQPTLVVSAKLGGSQAELFERLQVVEPVYVTHLTTDKPMYQPGEVVHFRSLTLDRSTLRPAEGDFQFRYMLKTPLGAESIVAQGSNGLYLYKGKEKAASEILDADKKPVRGVGAGELLLDQNIAGGEYTLIVSDDYGRFAKQERKFLVNSYQKPRLNKELDYGRKTYGPGDEVTARCKATRADDGRPVANRRVEATVNIDDKTYGADGKENTQPIVFKTDAEGVVTIRFRLPGEMDKGQASLAVKFDDGANTDTLSKPLPIVLKKLNVEFFPEGGDLVAGLTNRVYLQVRTTLGKPADLKGKILEDGKPLDCVVETLTDEKEPGVNQGMGQFTFKPKARTKYELQIDSPIGIAERYALPEVKEDGVVLSIAEGVTTADEPIKVQVHATKERELLIGAYCRGRLLDSVQLKKGQTEAVLKPAAGTGGVCRVTVFEELPPVGNQPQLRPVAERLMYRQPRENVSLAIHPNAKAYVPADKATVRIEAANEKDERAPVIVMVAVVDKSVLTLADEKTYRSMPTHFLLTTEVSKPDDLEYADFLLGKHDKAPVALDLLLGTQGWRRFAEKKPNELQEQRKAEVERLVVATGQSAIPTRDLAAEELNKVRAEFGARGAREQQLQAEYNGAEEKAKAALGDASYLTATAKLAKYDRFFHQLRFVGTPILAALLILIAVVCLVVGLGRKLARALPYYATVGACAVLLVLLGRIGLPGDRRALPVIEQQVAALGRDNNERELPPDVQGPVNADTSPTSGSAKEDPGRQRGNTGDKGEGKPFSETGTGPGGGLLPPGVQDGANQPKNVAPPPLTPAPPPVDLAAKPEAMVPQPVTVPAFAKDGKGGESKAGDAKDAPAGGFKNNKEMDKQPGDPHVALLEEKNKRKADDEVANQLRKDRMPPPGKVPAPGNARGQPDKDEFGKPAHARELPGGVPQPVMLVREYAHLRNGTDRNFLMTSADSAVRSDFTETLYWHPALVLPDGKGEFSFQLCDSVTTFQVTAFAHTLDGRLGAATQTLDSRLPFTLQPKTPIEVTASDKIDIPLAVSNNTAERRKVDVEIKEHKGLDLLRGNINSKFDVPANSPLRKLYRFQPSLKEGEASLTFEGKAGSFPDSVRNTFRVVPEGFPVAGSHSDLLEGTASKTVTLPQIWVKGTLKCQVQVYPSTLADLQKGLDALLREPHGCFEQTSTSNYPNLLILDYLKESDQANPEVERRARELLARGYQKLTSFECTNTAKGSKKEGYEWFGGVAPAHEALTAYGLMQFRDMARVQDVDPAMVKRTQEYLLSQRDGKGGFKRNPRALDTFGRAPEEVTNAYIIWALTEGGKEDDVSRELDALSEQAKTSKDPYFLSLVANSMLNRERAAEGVALLKKVSAAQKDDGHLDAERTSITGSGGRDLQIETTALAVLGWLKANNPTEFNVPLQKAVKWIGQQRGGRGGFGSTQSTILALKALIAFTRANKKTAEPGTITFFVGDKRVASVKFAAGASEALTLDLLDAEKHLRPGDNKVRVEITGKNVFPYTLAWSYQTLKPVSADNCPVKLETKLSQPEVQEGDTVRLTVKVENASGKGQGMAVAILGLPGGLIVPEDLKQLKEHARAPEDGSRPLISAFEIRGREVVLYWRDLAPDQKIEVPLDLIARVPGEYSGPASRAYLYYNADLKHWVEPLKMHISAKAE
jgi:hypothetical protein